MAANELLRAVALQVVKQIAQPRNFPYARIDVGGLEHIPPRGPCLLVANHRSFFDSVAMGFVAAGANRMAAVMGKKEIVARPVLGEFLQALGAIPVDRAKGGQGPVEAAAEALAQGEMVLIFPQGTIPRGAAFYDPVLQGRWGAAKIAALSRAPVIPVGLWGTERVWPRSSALPRMTQVLSPPRVRVRVGPPVDLKHRSAKADTERIMAAIMDLLPAESRTVFEPTEEQIRLATPAGYTGDLSAERTRKPGT